MLSQHEDVSDERDDTSEGLTSDQLRFTSLRFYNKMKDMVRTTNNLLETYKNTEKFCNMDPRSLAQNTFPVNGGSIKSYFLDAISHNKKVLNLASNLLQEIVDFVVLTGDTDYYLLDEDLQHELN